MQIESFKVFRDLAESASFSKAADSNGITQSAVSQQVRAIEEKFNVKLIDRGRRYFSLTPEGKAFLEASQDILDAYDGLGRKMQRLQNKVAGTISIATVLSIGLHELPPYLKEFRREFPQVDVKIEYKRSTQVYSSIVSGDADVGLVAYPSSRRGLRILTFWKDKLVLICAPSHPLARKRKVRLTELSGEKFVAFEPDLPTRKEIDRKLRQQGVKVSLLFEFDNIETVKRTVEIETAVSIVPETAVRMETKSGTLVALPIDAPNMWRPLGAIVRRTSQPAPAALRHFLAMLEKKDLGGEGADRKN